MDLSHLFSGDLDLDEAQDHHDLVVPHEMKMHMAKGFAHHAGIAPHPGEYKGPPLPVEDASVPTDWNDPEANYQSGQKREADAISNLSEGSAPVLPVPAPKSKVPGTVSDAFANWSPADSPDATTGS